MLPTVSVEPYINEIRWRYKAEGAIVRVHKFISGEIKMWRCGHKNWGKY
jgi:hypothetical protein